MRQQFNVRLPEITINQIKELIELVPAESQSHLIMLAVNRMYFETKAQLARDAQAPDLVSYLNE